MRADESYQIIDAGPQDIIDTVTGKFVDKQTRAQSISGLVNSPKRLI